MGRKKGERGKERNKGEGGNAVYSVFSSGEGCPGKSVVSEATICLGNGRWGGKKVVKRVK